MNAVRNVAGIANKRLFWVALPILLFGSAYAADAPKFDIKSLTAAWNARPPAKPPELGVKMGHLDKSQFCRVPADCGYVWQIEPVMKDGLFTDEVRVCHSQEWYSFAAEGAPARLIPPESEPQYVSRDDQRRKRMCDNIPLQSPKTGQILVDGSGGTWPCNWPKAGNFLANCRKQQSGLSFSVNNGICVYTEDKEIVIEQWYWASIFFFTACPVRLSPSAPPALCILTNFSSRWHFAELCLFDVDGQLLYDEIIPKTEGMAVIPGDNRQGDTLLVGGENGHVYAYRAANNPKTQGE